MPPAASLVLALLAAPEPPAAEEVTPQKIVAEAEAAWLDERWDDASVAFERAYEATGDATFLYTRAQAEKRAGRCETAIELYEAFIESAPPAKAETSARELIEECKAELPEPPPAEVSPVPDPTAGDPTLADSPASPTPTPATTTDEPTPTRPWYRDPWGGVLVGAGVAVAATGGVLVGVAHARADDAGDAPDDRAFGDELQGARRLETGGAIALGVGGALLVAGIVRWAVLGTRGRDRSALRITGTSLTVTLPEPGRRRRLRR